MTRLEDHTSELRTRYSVLNGLIVGPGGPYSIEKLHETQITGVCSTLERAFEYGSRCAQMSLDRPIDLRNGHLDNPYRLEGHFGDFFLIGPGGVLNTFEMNESDTGRFAEMLHAAFDFGFEERLSSEFSEEGVSPRFRFGDTAVSIGMHTPTIPEQQPHSLRSDALESLDTFIDQYAKHLEQGHLNRWEIALLNYGYAKGLRDSNSSNESSKI